GGQRGASRRRLGSLEILCRLSDHAGATMADFITVAESGGWRVDLKRAEAAGKLRLNRKPSCDKHGPRIELYDAQVALELLGKRHRVWVEAHEVSGPYSGPICIAQQQIEHLTPEELS